MTQQAQCADRLQRLRAQVVAEALKLLLAALPAAARAGGEPAEAAVAAVLTPLLVGAPARDPERLLLPLGCDVQKALAWQVNPSLCLCVDEAHTLMRSGCLAWTRAWIGPLMQYSMGGPRSARA